MVYYDCDTCGKEFKQKIDYERHKNRKNKCLPIKIDDSQLYVEKDINTTYEPHKPQINTQLINIHTQEPHNPHKIIESINASKTYCNYCNKNFSRLDSLRRHQIFYCLPKDEHLKDNNNKNVIDLLSDIKEQQIQINDVHKQEIIELKNTINELKEQNASIIAASAATSIVSSKGVLGGQVINSNNKVNNNNTVNNNTVNNNTINNNIILKFDDLNAYKRLDKKDIQYIMDAHEEVLIQRSVEVTHCNSKYPELNNVYIPDKKMRHGVAYTGEKFETIAIDKLITELIVSQQNNVCDYLDMKDIIIREDKRAKKDDIAENLLRYKDSRSEYKRDLYENVVKEVKLILYNNRERGQKAEKKIRNKE